MERIFNFNNNVLVGKTIKSVYDNGDQWIIFFDDDTYLTICDGGEYSGLNSYDFNSELTKWNYVELYDIGLIDEIEHDRMDELVKKEELKRKEENDLLQLRDLMIKYKDKI